jgi:5'-3' exonuclease
MRAEATLVLDASNLLYRCLLSEGTGWLATKAGRSTGGTYGVVQSIRKLLHENSDVTRVVMVMDGGLSKRRIDLYAGYKLKRRQSKDKAKELAVKQAKQEEELEGDVVPLPRWADRWGTTAGGRLKKIDISSPKWRYALNEAFSENFEDLRTILPHLGVRQARLWGREGDDIIARIATDRSMSADLAIIVSEDKDFYQLVDKRISVFRPIADQLVVPNSFERIAKMPKWAYLFARAVEGDTSDEIEGVKGVGEKSIAKVIEALSAEQPASMHAAVERALEFCKQSDDKRLLKVAESEDVVRRNVAVMDLMVECDEFTVEEEDKLYEAMEAPVGVNLSAASDLLAGIEAHTMAQALRDSSYVFQSLGAE